MSKGIFQQNPGIHSKAKASARMLNLDGSNNGFNKTIILIAVAFGGLAAGQFFLRQGSPIGPQGPWGSAYSSHSPMVAYPPPGYAPPGYFPQGYAQPAYPQAGYGQPVYSPQGYGPPGMIPHGGACHRWRPMAPQWTRVRGNTDSVTKRRPLVQSGLKSNQNRCNEFRITPGKPQIPNGKTHRRP